MTSARAGGAERTGGAERGGEAAGGAERGGGSLASVPGSVFVSPLSLAPLFSRACVWRTGLLLPLAGGALIG